MRSTGRAPPNGLGAQLRSKALTLNATAPEAPSAGCSTNLRVSGWARRGLHSESRT